MPTGNFLVHFWWTHTRLTNIPGVVYQRDSLLYYVSIEPIHSFFLFVIRRSKCACGIEFTGITK